MIWPILADLIWISNLERIKIISEASRTRRELISILVITTIALTINHLITGKSTQKREEILNVVTLAVGIIAILSFISDSRIIYLVIIEISIMPLAYLIITRSKDRDKIESIKFIVMINTAGSIPFIVFSRWGERILKQEVTPFSMKIKAGILILMLLFLIKTPIFMIHAWLTKAHVAASGNCSILLARIIIKLGTVGIIKFYKFFQKEGIFYLLTRLSLVSSFYLTWVIFRFFDSKTLIAISSILHISMLIPMMIIKKRSSILSSVMIIAAHGVVSYYLFYLITQKYEMAESRTSLSIKRIESTDKTLALVLVTFIFLNLGLPPFINFISECYFLVSLGLLKSWRARIFLALILLTRVIFTMQMRVNALYGKTKNRIKKSAPTIMPVKSLFYFLWTILIMLAI